ncbi:hypothetical protein ACLB2K_074313 [Fragaria x ananassa]
MEDKKNPRYCCYHQIVGHPTPTCQTLRKILHAKIDEGTLELPSKKQAIDDDPLPKRHGKGVWTVITGVDKTCQGEENMYGALALSVYQSPIDQAAWYQYCRGQGYADPFFTQYDWNNNSAMEGQKRARFSNDDHCYQAYQVTKVDDDIVETNFMRRNMPSAMEVLQQNPKFKSLFDQLEYEPEARYAAAKALMDVSETFGPQCFATGTETQRGRSLLEGDNAIVFTDKDMEVDYPDHRRPLYLEAQINDVLVRRALVDTESSLNIISLQVLTAAGISLAKIVKTSMSIPGFANGSEEAVSYILLNLKVGPIQSLTKFYVVDADTSYHALLGRLWLNKHKLVPSTYHQCLKGRIRLKPVRLPGNHIAFH